MVTIRITMIHLEQYMDLVMAQSVIRISMDTLLIDIPAVSRIHLYCYPLTYLFVINSKHFCYYFSFVYIRN